MPPKKSKKDLIDEQTPLKSKKPVKDNNDDDLDGLDDIQDPLVLTSRRGEKVTGSPTMVFALFMVVPVIHAVSWGIFLRLYFNQAINQFILPIFTDTFGIAIRDIPNFSILVLAMWSFVISSFIHTVAKAGTKAGYDNREPRSTTYTGIVGRMVAAHQHSIEVFPVFATALIMSAQFGVSLNMRAQFAVYSLIFRFIHYIFYLLNVDFLRSIAHASLMAPLFLLMAASAIPGFTKNYLTTGW
ncbi:hypothetical protein HDU76_007858 [Blyttiomyces sp. JEL0837]|nr:hypothetical protein HDU76_007858 [Blyttiomyces sp. JEL0837]